MKLGYGGTKTEMERLISDASKLTDVQKELGITVDANDMSFGNIVNAISVVQKEMGIMGTTSKEASETIQGSVSAMKSAWQNLLTGISNSNVDKDMLTQNFISSVKTVAKNLIPVIKETVKGLVEVAGQLMNELFNTDKYNFDGDKFVAGLENAIKRVVDLMQWFIDNRSLIVGSITAILSAFAIGKIASFANTMITLVTTLSGIPAVTTAVTTAMTMLGGAFTFITSPIGLVVAGITGLVATFVILWNKCDAFRNFWIGTWDIIKNTVSISIEKVKEFLNSAKTFISNFADRTVEFLKKIPEWFSQLPSKVSNFLSQTISKLSSFAQDVGAKSLEAGRNIVDKITSTVKDLPSKMFNWGKDMIQGMINGIKSMINNVKNAVKNVADTIKKFLHFSRPDEGPLREYETWMPDMVDGLVRTLYSASPKLYNASRDLASTIRSGMNLDGMNSSSNSQSNIISYDNMVIAFEQALSSMKIELDDEIAGKFVKRTVADAIYN